MDVLPDFGADGKEFGVAEAIAHAFKQFIGARIESGFLVCRRDGQDREAHQRGNGKSRSQPVSGEFEYSVVHILFLRMIRWFVSH